MCIHLDLHSWLGCYIDICVRVCVAGLQVQYVDDYFCSWVFGLLL